jgi:hypothetical protein
VAEKGRGMASFEVKKMIEETFAACADTSAVSFAHFLT